MANLRLGSKAPDFTAETTKGKISFHEWIGDSWVCALITSHDMITHFLLTRPSFSRTLVTSPLCAPPSSPKSLKSEFLSRVRYRNGCPDYRHRAPEWEARNVKVIGISTNGLDDHHKWVADIEEWGNKYSPTTVDFPIVCRLSSVSHAAVVNITWFG